MVIFGEAHLRRILSSYERYYNQARTHLALQKDAPLHRAVQRSGAIVAVPILAGLHHQSNNVMPGLDPGIQGQPARSERFWIAGSSPAMTRDE